ncbi:glycoside hydrolase family 108 protein [Selenihalanaerobacter shriftii]|uniref:Predicted Peptidoglycan domain-containing protein n=1 Tax=Selenihalanaerobacter shriftii TaxID=142842 RepID=A0A1T4LH27_9FIRM|nr:glycosyl hydrolase 108 family protein [Selenihalanaerobacter shriftii]SJZ53744.1 Predicted Peptidoglycan domain-containing protein [Selenihalanaerobacter shriftii]
MSEKCRKLFEKAFEKILEYEGDYSNDEDDHGGKTKYGITEELARNVGYTGSIKELTLEKAKDIYYNNFWIKYNYNEIGDDRVAIECFEQAVNMGPDTAIKNLQKAYNLLSNNEIVVDGIVGPQTLNAVNNNCEHKDALLKLLNIFQAEKYIGIVKNDESQKKFIRGWLKRVEI